MKEIIKRSILIVSIIYVVIIIHLICGQLNTPTEERSLSLLKFICYFQNNLLMAPKREKSFLLFCLVSLSLLIQISFFSDFVYKLILANIFHIIFIQLFLIELIAFGIVIALHLNLINDL